MQAFVLQGIPEELLFRGYLVRTAGDRLPMWGVVILSSTLFGIIHLVSKSPADSVAERLLYAVSAMGLGALATAARLASGSVWAAVGVRGGFHVANGFVGLWLAPVLAEYGSYLVVLAAVQLAVARLVLLWTVRSGRLRWREPLPA